MKRIYLLRNPTKLAPFARHRQVAHTPFVPNPSVRCLFLALEFVAAVPSKVRAAYEWVWCLRVASTRSTPLSTQLTHDRLRMHSPPHGRSQLTTDTLTRAHTHVCPQFMTCSATRRNDSTRRVERHRATGTTTALQRVRRGSSDCRARSQACAPACASTPDPVGAQPRAQATGYRHACTTARRLLRGAVHCGHDVRPASVGPYVRPRLRRPGACASCKHSSSSASL